MLGDDIGFTGNIDSLPFGSVAPVTGNQVPIAIADSYTTEFETALAIDATAGVLASDSDPDGDTLTAELVTGPTAHWHLIPRVTSTTCQTQKIDRFPAPVRYSIDMRFMHSIFYTWDSLQIV